MLLLWIFFFFFLLLPDRRWKASIDSRKKDNHRTTCNNQRSSLSLGPRRGSRGWGRSQDNKSITTPSMDIFTNKELRPLLGFFSPVSIDCGLQISLESKARARVDQFIQSNSFNKSRICSLSLVKLRFLRLCTWNATKRSKERAAAPCSVPRGTWRHLPRPSSGQCCMIYSTVEAPYTSYPFQSMPKEVCPVGGESTNRRSTVIFFSSSGF